VRQAEKVLVKQQILLEAEGVAEMCNTMSRLAGLRCTEPGREYLGDPDLSRESEALINP
jgi:hypothetical protein